MMLVKKTNNKIAISSLAGLALLIGAGIGLNEKASATNTSANSVSDMEKAELMSQANKCFTRQQVIEDIDYVINTIKRYHVSCVNEVPKEVMEQKELEIQNLSEKTNTMEEWMIISRILAKFHDAHTQVMWPKFAYGKRLPFDAEVVGDKFFCRSGDFKDSEIVEINGMKIADIYENYKRHLSYEIEEWPWCHFYKWRLFISQATLSKAGIDTLNPITVGFKTENGIETRSFELVPIEYSQFKKPFVSYKIDKDNGIGIFTLNECNFNDEYRKTVDDFFADVVSNNIKSIIVDLRKNGGGTDRVIWYFGKYLKNLENITFGKMEERIDNGIETRESYKVPADEIKKNQADKNLFGGKIFILTSNWTFSSAQLFARNFSDNNLATIIGEVPGNSPTAYGDIGGHNNFCTPNSKLIFSSTYKKFYRPDTSKSPDRLIPDIHIPAEDAMTKAYELINS